MSDQYLTNDVLGVIVICADVRTAVNLSMTCHSIPLPALSHWLVVVDDVEMLSDDEPTSSRSVLRADPPILHGEIIIAYGSWRCPAILHYDRGALTHATVSGITWFGSRRIYLHGVISLIYDDNETHTVAYDDATATLYRERQSPVTFQSRPDDDSALEILRWYARVMPDTKPAVTAITVLQSALYPIPRWMR